MGFIIMVINRLLLVFTCSMSCWIAPKMAAQENSKIDLQLEARFNSQQEQIIKTWLSQGLSAVEHSIAPFPQKHLPISVLRHHNNRQPVPWGQVVRGEPDTIQLHVAPNASLNALSNDWTFYHEVSHLYLPYLDYSSFWLGEGFATYMQYIIMFQANLLSRKQFIERMNAGFERGRRTTMTKPGRLKDVANNMWQLRAYRRVYWSGASFFLEADLALQQQGKSLNQVISAYVNCCLTKNSRGIRLVRQFDRLSQSNIFEPLFHKYANRTDFPKVTSQQLATIAEFYQPEVR